MTGDRRPIASRELALAKSVAHFLAMRGATPNGISIAGMIFGILAGVLLTLTNFSSLQLVGFLGAAACIQLRLLANMFDGMVAIEARRTSAVGELYNEIPDRVSDSATLVGAGYALGSVPEWGYWSAILALFIAYIRAQGKVAGAQQEYCGPMAKQQRMFVIFVACLIAMVAPEVSLSIVNSGSSIGVLALAIAVVVIGEVVTIFRRLARIASTLKEQAK